MRFDVLTIFPGLFEPFVRLGVLGRAVNEGLVEIRTHDLRAFAGNRWGKLDDEAYGGGAGMVLQAPPVLEAVEQLREQGDASAELILFSPRGRPLDQELASELSDLPALMLLCGRYEGIDERVSELLEPREISIGDYILGGGEVAAMALIEAVSRLVPGVVGDPASVEEDSFTAGLLDYPCYTRPPEVRGIPVPEVLLSGHHEKIRQWRLARAVELTVKRRPDLIRKNRERYTPEVRRLIRRFAPGPTDEIEDPGNLGAIIRTAACAEIDGIIIGRYKSAPITPYTTKVSEGGINHIKIIRVGSIMNTIKLLKEYGYTVIGTKMNGNIPYFKQKYPLKTALILGNEGKGLGQKTIEKCDYTIQIPISSKMESLNVSSSASILIYEWIRQRTG